MFYGRLRKVGLIRRAMGEPSDWNLRRPSVRPPTLGIHWLGPTVVIATVAVSWLAFSGVENDPNAAFGQYVGAVSIMLMAWNFVLAVRAKPMEVLFGGLDRIYRVHRWCGSLSIALMFIHVSTEPKLRSGIPGAAASTASTARDFASVGEVMLYVLVGASLLRVIPYRYWRWTHKLMVVPFVFASWHFQTSSKPYRNSSGWGRWFAVFMIAGFVAYLMRVVVLDVFLRGVRYRVESVAHGPTTTDLKLVPDGRRRLRSRAGQFAIIKIRFPGLAEPHPFTIASSPNDDHLRFIIRDLGDWTRLMRRRHIEGAAVIVEGPFGVFRPRPPRAATTVWIAGGVGITPFLSSLDDGTTDPPHLFYAVRNREDSPAVDELEAADARGQVRLHLIVSSEGDRLSKADLVREFGPVGLRRSHVALCGPDSLVRDMTAAARSMGARRIEREEFDMRHGFGPEISRDIEDLLSAMN